MLEFQITSEQIAEDELLTPAKLNRMVRPTVAASGTIEASNIADQAVEPGKLDEDCYAFHHGTMSGGPTAYTAVMSPVITGYDDGMLFSLQVLTANTGPSTLAVDGLATARKICKFTYGTSATALVDIDDGDLLVGAPVLLIYLASVNGGVGAFVLLNAPAKSAVLHGVCEGSVVNTYTVLVDGPLNTSLGTPKDTLLGRLITFTTPASLPNTGAVTVTIKTVTGSTPLPALALNRGGVGLIANDLPVSTVVWCWYDGTDLEWLNPPGGRFETSVLFTDVKDAVQPYSVAHGLGKTPKFLSLWFVCVTTELGYLADEAVPIPSFSDDGGTTGTDWVCWADATQIYFRTGATPAIRQRSASSFATITHSKWNLAIRASL